MKKDRIRHFKRIRIMALVVIAVVVCSFAFSAFAATGAASPDAGKKALGGILGTLLGVGIVFGMTVESQGMNEETFTPDKLIAGSTQIVGESGDLASGENRARGALCGKITLGAVSEAHAGNTGDGAMTIDAVTPRLANCQPGAYTATCINAVGGGGTFRVADPKGNVLGDVLVGDTFENQIKFSIAAGNADFIVGDTFTITVAAGSKKWKLSAAAALDGSQVPCGVLSRATNASGGDTTTGFYVKGEFNENAIVFGAGHTADSVRDQLRALGIHLQPSVTA